MSYKKVGGLHFVRIGRLGFSFFWSRKTRAQLVAETARAERRAENLARLRGELPREVTSWR